MKSQFTVILSLILCLPGLAAADDPKSKCKEDILRGQYVFTASGFTRAPNSVPGTPWVPKAAIQVTEFNGDGTLSTPTTAAAPCSFLTQLMLRTRYTSTPNRATRSG